MQVYQFEREWHQFWHAPRRVKREAFAELVAIAHFHAAAMAHAGSTHVFEMILLVMLVGLVRRAETLQAQGVPVFPGASPDAPPLQETLRAIMHVLRQRLSKQNSELYLLARAMRTEDQIILRDLLNAAESRTAPVPLDVSAAPDEILLTALVESMRRIRRLEKQYRGQSIITLEEWSRVCSA
jgi:hypothetical protein